MAGLPRRAVPRSVHGAMRWSDFTASLSPEAQSRLVNAVTAGWGYARLATLAAERDRPAGVVVYRLDRAVMALRDSQQVLAPSSPSTSDDQPVYVSVERSELTWRAFVATLGTERAARLRRAMADGVVDARRVAEMASLDGDVVRAQRHLERSLTALTRARHLCTPDP